LEERREEARENARHEQLLKLQLATMVKLNEELDRSKAFEERLFMLLEKALQ
jgi:hypothetical protein